jgi:hypothetical protein
MRVKGLCLQTSSSSYVEFSMHAAHQDEGDGKRQHAAGMLDALVAHDGEWKRDLEELHSNDIGDEQACYEEPACTDRGWFTKMHLPRNFSNASQE